MNHELSLSFLRSLTTQFLIVIEFQSLEIRLLMLESASEEARLSRRCLVTDEKINNDLSGGARVSGESRDQHRGMRPHSRPGGQPLSRRRNVKGITAETVREQ